MTVDKKSSALSFKKQVVTFTERKNISSTVDGQSAVLAIQIVDNSMGNPGTVTVSTVKEDGNWKMDTEKYKF